MMPRLALGLAVLTLVAVPRSKAEIVPAPGWAVRSIPTAAEVQGGVVRRGQAILVGQGPSFTAGAQSIVRLVEGQPATTIAVGFNSLGGFFLDDAETLWAVDNCWIGDGCGDPVTGDTLYAVPDALTRTTPLAAPAAAVLPAGAIAAPGDVLRTRAGEVLVTDALGPGAGRILRVGGAGVVPFATGLDYLGGLAEGGDGTLLVANLDAGFAGAVLRFAADGTALGPLATGLAGAYDVVLDGQESVLVSGAFDGPVLAIAADGTAAARASGFGFSTEMFHDVARDETLVLDAAARAITALCRDGDGDGRCDADDACPDDPRPAGAAGPFAGGGRRPADDGLVTFWAPTGRRSTVTGDTAALAIVLRTDVPPDAVRVRVGRRRVDTSALRPGCTATIAIALRRRRTVVRVEATVAGTGGRRVVDRDRLILVRRGAGGT